MLGQIKNKRCFLSLMVDGIHAGCGLGIMESGYLGVFDIVVDPDLRSRGLGRIIVESVLQWGKQQGAETAYLQVMKNNLPAINLYRKIGFKEVYKYWYRKKP